MATPAAGRQIRPPAPRTPVPDSVGADDNVVTTTRLQYLRSQLADARSAWLAMRATRDLAATALATTRGVPAAASDPAWRQIQSRYYAALDAYIQSHLAFVEKASDVVTARSERTHRFLDQERHRTHDRTDDPTRS